MIEERQETVAGKPANRIVYALRDQGVSYRNVLVVVAIGDTGYSFNLFALPGSSDTLQADLQTVLLELPGGRGSLGDTVPPGPR